MVILTLEIHYNIRTHFPANQVHLEIQFIYSAVNTGMQTGLFLGCMTCMIMNWGTSADIYLPAAYLAQTGCQDTIRLPKISSNAMKQIPFLPYFGCMKEFSFTPCCSASTIMTLAMPKSQFYLGLFQLTFP